MRMNEYAVLVPTVKTENGEALLLEVRSDKVKQPGEICFPGGRVEKGESPAETAVRETCEELGLHPGDIKISGDPVLEIMGDGRRVWSVWGKIEAGCLDRLELSGAEVAGVFLLPLEWLANNPPALYDLGKTQDRDLPGKLRDYLAGYESFLKSGSTYYWEYDGHGIWGLTARIISNRIINTRINYSADH